MKYAHVAQGKNLNIATELRNHLTTKDDDDITRIEDLPDIQRDDIEDDFTDLDAMAQNLGIKDFETNLEPEKADDDSQGSNTLDDMPSFSHEEDFPTTESFSDKEDFSSEQSISNEEDFSSEQSISNEGDFSSEQSISNEEESSPQEAPIEHFPTSELTDLKDLNDIDSTIASLPTRKTEIIHEEDSLAQESEDFKEVKDFAKNTSLGDFSGEGNPPYSIIIKNLKYYEDIDSIAKALIEFNVIKEAAEAQLKENLERGQILIPRLSEYAAIVICHRLRGFDIEILMGLTEEINPPKFYTSNDRGLTTKKTLLNNKKYYKSFEQHSSQMNILTTTLTQIEGYNVTEYLGIITHTSNLSSKQLASPSIEEEILDQVSSTEKKRLEKLRLTRENLLSARSDYHQVKKIAQENPSLTPVNSLTKIYDELVEKLKAKAKAKGANGVLGISFSINAIAIESYLTSGPKYQILCSGNMVCLKKR